jgi:hypothetical protein
MAAKRQTRVKATAALGAARLLAWKPLYALRSSFLGREGT